jgi:hypothetical protein
MTSKGSGENTVTRQDKDGKDWEKKRNDTQIEEKTITLTP